MAEQRQRTPDERFALFVQRVDDMVELRAFREGTIRAHFTITGGRNVPNIFDVGDEEDLRSVLVAFRRFTADKEDVHVGRIANLVERHVTDDRCREHVRSLRDQWAKERTGMGQIYMNGVALDGFDLYVNGRIFHDDPEKDALLTSLPDFMTGMLWTQAASFVIGGSRVLCAIRNNLKHWLDGIPVPEVVGVEGRRAGS